MGRRLILTASGLLLGLAGAIAAAAANYAWEYRQDGFRFEGILSVVAIDLDRDGRAELAVAGRNYLAGETAVELHEWRGETFSLLWRSRNLLESESSLLILPVEWPEGPALVALTRTGYHIIRHRDGKYAEVAQGAMTFYAEEGASGDLDGDGYDELIVSTTLRNTRDGREKALRVLAWDGGDLTVMASSEPIGNIRSLAAGDLDGDGRAEVVAEAGVTVKAGQFHLLRLAEGALIRESARKTSLPAVAYGLTVGRQFPDPGRFLFAAGQPGIIRSYARAELEPGGTNLSFSGSPLSLTLGDLDGDGREEMVVACYPARLHILRPTAPFIGLRVAGEPRPVPEPLLLWEGDVYAEVGAAAEALGLLVTEQPAAVTLSGVGEDSPTLTVALDTLAVSWNGGPIALTPGPRWHRNRLYLPLAQLASLMGYNYAWNENGHECVIENSAVPGDGSPLPPAEQE